MRNEPMLRRGSPPAPPTDGWLGTRELPGYRAGHVIAKLNDLPEVDPHHLYFDLLLLDARGYTEDNYSGPCVAVARHDPLEARSRFVRVVAELARHVRDDARGLSVLGRAVAFVRECGVAIDRLIPAAQLLDEACSERTVSDSLYHLLELSLGEAQASREMGRVVGDLARNSEFGEFHLGDTDVPTAQAFDDWVRAINEGGLAAQVAYIVHTVGKTRARQYLREVIPLEMVPKPDIFGA